MREYEIKIAGAANGYGGEERKILLMIERFKVKPPKSLRLVESCNPDTVFQNRVRLIVFQQRKSTRKIYEFR